MRSVFVHLRDATESAVRDYLTRHYAVSNAIWVDVRDGTTYLYIDFYRDAPNEFEPEEWDALIHALGGAPTVSVVADVSGRIPGDQEVREFLFAILEEFTGLAQDDGTNHYWTADEIRENRRFDGLSFFDYHNW